MGPREDVPLEVVRRLAAGDADALGEVFEREGDRIYRTVRRICGQDADAEDVTQDAFLRIFAKAHQFRGQSRFTTWMTRVAVSVALNALKRSRRHPAAPLSAVAEPPAATDPATDPVAAASEQEALALLDRLIAGLSPKLRAVFVLREMENQSYEEIAEGLGLRPGTVMSRLSRARRRLAEMAGSRLTPDSGRWNDKKYPTKKPPEAD